MKIKIPKASDLLLETDLEKSFSLDLFRDIYEYNIQFGDQTVVYIYGLKGARKTSLGFHILEAIGLPIESRYIARTLPQLWMIYKEIIDSSERVPYIFIDDAGNIIDKWGTDRIKKLIYKIVNVDRPFAPLVIITDTMALGKHIRRLADIWVLCEKLDAVYSLARFYTTYIDVRTGETKPKRIGMIKYKYNIPEWLASRFHESRKEEIRELLEELKEEMLIKIGDKWMKHLEEGLNDEPSSL